MANLIRSVQVSDPAAPLSRGDLATLIESSQRYPMHGLTGLLLYAGGHFLQVLEGPAEAVAMAEQLDIGGRRFLGAHRLTCDITTERLFEHWTVRRMNLAALEPGDRARFRRLVEWAAEPTASPDPRDVIELLESLRPSIAA